MTVPTICIRPLPLLSLLDDVFTMKRSSYVLFMDTPTSNCVQLVSGCTPTLHTAAQMKLPQAKKTRYVAINPFYKLSLFLLFLFFFQLHYLLPYTTIS